MQQLWICIALEHYHMKHIAFCASRGQRYIERVDFFGAAHPVPYEQRLASLRFMRII